MSKVVIIGAGAAGLFAAFSASAEKNDVIVFEKNEKAGKKIYITGKGRCNLTNDCSVSEYVKNVVRNPKFTYGAINAFSPSDVMIFFENNGLKLKTERGNRVFPLSDKASDVTKTLLNACEKNGVKFYCGQTVEEILFDNGKVFGVTVSGKVFGCDSVICCTGGVSYPLTGSTGDGYKFALSARHSVTPIKPALVGIELNGTLHKNLQGLSLKNVALSAFIKGKKVFYESGEMLFTHYGISGPIVLSCSSLINRADRKDVLLSLDLKPALTEEVLDARILREFKSFNKKSVVNAMFTLEPKSLAAELLKSCKISGDKPCCEITAFERGNLLRSIKNLLLEFKSLRPIDEAIITSGGVNVDEINPKTMESKLVKGLFFAGEVLDVDAFTGGFNLQTAFSTGYVAGKNA